MSPPDVDLAILGGGCAGLSLAARLAAQGPDAPQVAVIEPRSSYNADRTWAFWDGGGADPLVDDLIEMRWPAWQIGTPDRAILHRSASRPYAVVPSRRFYASTERTIEASANVRLIRGTQATDLLEQADRVEIETSQGRLSAAHVIDARPPQRAALAGAILHQAFMGAEVEAERPVFDPSAVELMTDMRVDDDGFVFAYVLPFNPHRALIEVTRFVETPRLLPGLEAELGQAIACRTAGSPHLILRREQGVLPMGLEPIRSDQRRIVAAGTAAGAGRAATGYAFLRIQRWAAACAVTVRAGSPPLPHPTEPPLRRAMDHLFLRVLREHPALAPRLFLALAGRLGAETFVRFLSDQAGPRDLAAVVTALPPGPFLRTLISTRAGADLLPNREPA